jgi:hypothetical protein
VIRTVHVGLGTIGQLCLRAAAGRTALHVAAAIDPRADLVGRDAGEVAGLPRPLGVRVVADWQGVPAADVAIICTTSRLAELRAPVATALAHGLDVVSTCEELAAPPADSVAAQEIDQLARAAGRRVLGAGVNPGFVMDALPLVLSAAVSELRAVRVRRAVDVRTRRPQLAAKVGVGLPPAEFEARRLRGEIGHVGLAASARLLAAGLGWTIDSLSESVQPVLRADWRCAGVHQELRAWVGGAPRIVLELTIAEAVAEPGDTIWLDGLPSLEWRAAPAIPGDEATAALVVNAVLALPALPPGLRTVADLAPLRYRASGPGP